MSQVIATVFGRYTHGKLAGQVNPGSSVTMTISGETRGQALKNLKAEIGDAAFKVQTFREV